MRGSDGNEGCGMFEISAGGRCESGASTQLKKLRRQIPTLAASCVALHTQTLFCLKPISQHLKDSWSPPPLTSLPGSKPRRRVHSFSSHQRHHWYWSYVSGRERHLTSISQHCPGVVSRKWVGWLGRWRVNPWDESRQGQHDSSMQIEEAKLHGGIAISQRVLIKTTHLFCIEVPANEMASLNCGLCAAIRREGVTGRKKRDNLTFVFYNETSHNNTEGGLSGRLFVNSNIHTV